jgi:hypothetical protein
LRKKFIDLTFLGSLTGGRARSVTSAKAERRGQRAPRGEREGRRLTRILDDLIDDPEGRLVLEVLVPVNFLLLVRPVGKERILMGPHRDPRINMHELEMTALSHPLLPLVRIINLNLEPRIRELVLVDTVPGGELGVGRQGRAGDVVCEESGVGEDVTEGDDIVLTDNATTTGFGDLLGRLDNPVVIGVVEGVGRDLLACGLK